jgi:hypothetical protein
MTFASGEYNYTLQEFVDNVKESMVDGGCNSTCVDSILTANASTFEAVSTECGCPTYMLRYNQAQTLNLADEAPAEEAKAEEPAAEAPADKEVPETEETSENKTEEPVAVGNYTPLFVIGGSLGLVSLLIGVFCCRNKSGSENEGGDFEMCA